MDLLLQVSEEELEEFPEPPVDHTDQYKPDRSNTGGTLSSSISHQLQTQDSDSDQYSFQSFQGLNSFVQSAAQVQKTCKATSNVTSNATS